MNEPSGSNQILPSIAIVRTTLSPKCCYTHHQLLRQTLQEEYRGIMYRNLENKFLAIVVGLECIENWRELVSIELD